MAGIELVIFDLDGTLVDSVPDLTDAVNHFLVNVGRPVLSSDQVRKLVGKGARNLVERALGNATEDEVDGCLAQFLAYNDAHIADKTTIYPGVADVLHELRIQGRRMAVISNKTTYLCKKLLAVLSLDQYFDAVRGADSYTSRKPSPEPILALLRELAVSPGSAVMVGDSINDIAAGKGAGVVTVACTFGYGTPLEWKEADYAVASMPELLRLALLRKNFSES